MANLAILRGNIGSMEELKQVGGDNSLLKFTLATTKRIKGEDKTTWHRCVAWGKTAEIMAQHLSKGSQIYLQGEIDNDSYDDKEGRKVYTSEIIVREFEFCGSKNTGKQDSDQGQSQNSNAGSNRGSSQNNNSNAGQSNFSNPPFNPDDEQIPFN